MDLAHLLDLTKLDLKILKNLKKLKNPKFCERSHSTNLTNSINVINKAIIIKILQNLKILKNLKISFFEWSIFIFEWSRSHITMWLGNRLLIIKFSLDVKNHINPYSRFQDLRLWIDNKKSFWADFIEWSFTLKIHQKSAL